MAYQGYLIRLQGSASGNYTITPDKIKLNSYSVVWESQDRSAYRDANGMLHRNALPSRPPKVEFYTKNMMTNAQLSNFMGAIRARSVSLKERKYIASIYIPEIDDYVTDEVYMVDPQPSIYRVDGNTIYYNSFRIAFIGYGTSGSYK